MRWKKFFRPYAATVTLFVFLLIGLLSLISLNLHFLDPFSYGVKDYDVTDIVYSRFRSQQTHIDDRIVIVNTGRPDRATIAAMLERIIAAQPKAVGLDVLFAGRREGQGDSLLQAALKKSDRIVISSLLQNYRSDLGRFEAEAGVDTFFSHHAHTGYANFPSSQTKTIRFFSPLERTAQGRVSSFAFELIRQADPPAAERLLEREKELERIHYTATGDNFIHFEPENILDTNIDLQDALEGKIVLVGYSDDRNDECPLLDKYYTPFNERYSGRSEPDMFGIVIHANIVRMALDHQFIRTVPAWLSFLLAVLFCYANVILLEWIHKRYPTLHHPIIRILQVLEFTVLFFLLSLLFYAFRLKWDFTIGLLALALYFDVLLSYEAFTRNSWRGPNKLPQMLRKKEKG